MNNYIGCKLASLRKNKIMTQEQLASMLGGTTQAASKWETHTSLPDCALLPKIAEIFNVSIDYLFDYKPKSFDETGRICEAILNDSKEEEIYQKAFHITWELQKSLARALRPSPRSVLPVSGTPEMPGRSTSIIRRKYKTIIGLNGVNKMLGYKEIEILTPESMVGEEENNV